MPSGIGNSSSAGNIDTSDDKDPTDQTGDDIPDESISRRRADPTGADDDTGGGDTSRPSPGDDPTGTGSSAGTSDPLGGGASESTGSTSPNSGTPNAGSSDPTGGGANESTGSTSPNSGTPDTDSSDPTGGGANKATGATSPTGGTAGGNTSTPNEGALRRKPPAAQRAELDRPDPEPQPPEQGVEELPEGKVSRRRSLVAQQAAGLEQELLGRYPYLDEQDVRVTQEGDKLRASLNEAGREEVVATRYGVDPEDVRIEGDTIIAETEEARNAFAMRRDRDRPDPTRADDRPSDPGGTSALGTANESISRRRESPMAADDTQATQGGDVRLAVDATEAANKTQATQGGDVRLAVDATKAANKTQSEDTEQFGDVSVTNPLTGNRVEKDLQTAEQRLQEAARTAAVATTLPARIGRALFASDAQRAPNLTPNAGSSGGVASQPIESIGSVLNPASYALGAKESAEFTVTQPQRAASSPREFAGDVEQRARQIATSTAERATSNPAEFAVGTGTELVLGVGIGSVAGKAIRIASGGRIDGSDLTGRAVKRAEESARRLAGDDRGQADLTGPSLDDETVDLLEERALSEVDDARTQELEQLTFVAERRAANRRNEADLEDVANDYGTRTVSRRESRSVSGQTDVFTASGDVDTSRSGPTRGQREAFRSAREPEDLGLSPRERQLAAQADRPDQDLREAASSRVDELTDTRLDTDARLADSLGGASLFGLSGEREAARSDSRTRSRVRGAIGADSRLGAESQTRAGADARSDTRTRLDTGLRGDTRLDAGTRLDTGLRQDTDSRVESDLRQDLTSRTDTRQDTRQDTRLDSPLRGDPDRRDLELPFDLGRGEGSRSRGGREGVSDVLERDLLNPFTGR